MQVNTLPIIINLSFEGPMIKKKLPYFLTKEKLFKFYGRLAKRIPFHTHKTQCSSLKHSKLLLNKLSKIIMQHK